MRATCVILKGEGITYSDTGRSRICQKKQQGRIYTVWQNYC